jgi:RHS repeat-associated protein
VHTGLVGGTAAMPPVTFEPTSKPNRVLTAHNTTNNRQRIANIITETGAKVQVTYSQPGCKAGDLPSAPHTNTKLCYPVIGPDPTDPEGPEITEWWHKYVVTKVSESDLQVMADGTDHGAPVQNTFYAYGGTPAWHFADDDGLVRPKRKTWNQFRGYSTVDVRTGDAPDQTLTRTTYLRGMNGDRATPTGGTRTVTLSASVGGDTVYDEDQFAGMVREQVVYNGSDNKPVSKTVNVPWMSSPSASRTINGDTVTARFTNTKTTYHATALGVDGDRGWRTSRTVSAFNDVYGTIEQTQDDGDIAKTGDEQCVTNSYNRNTAKNIVETVKQTTTLAVQCGTAPADADDVISDVRNYYDGATGVETAPTYGSVTKTEKLKDWTPGSGTVWQTTGQSTLDAFGRPRTFADVRGNTTTTDYTPATGPVTKVTTSTPDPNGGAAWVSSVENRPYWGTPIRSTDVNGRTSDADYDPLGRVTKVWKIGWSKADHLDKPSVEYGYVYSPTCAAYPYTVTKTLNAAGGYLTLYQISDAFLRPRQTQTAGVGGGRVVTDTLYDKVGRAATTYGRHVEPDDPAGALWWEPEWSVPALTKTVYDNASRPTSEIVFGTDGVANLVEKWRTTADNEGDMVKVTPPSGGTPTTTLTDIRGQTIELRQHTTGEGVDGPYQATHYTYDRKNQLSKITDPAGNQWTYTFDPKGRQVRADDPDKGRTTSDYNDYDDLIKTTDANGDTLAYQYDKIGRKIGLYDHTVSPATKRAEWTYDQLYDGQTVRGQLTATARYEPAGSATAYRWQVRDFTTRYQPGGVNYVIPAAEGQGLAGTHVYSYGYSAYDGTATELGYPAVGDLPAETVTTRYDQTSGLPAELETNFGNAGNYVAAQQYTAYGEPTVTTRKTAGGVYVEDADYYDLTTRRLQRTTVQPETADGFADDTGYTYDPAGNITSIVQTTPVGGTDSQCFRHDPLRRLASAWTPKSGITCDTAPSLANLGGPAPYWLDWDVDRKTGNRLSEVSHRGAGDVSHTYTYPGSGADAVRPHAISSVTTTGFGQAETTAEYAYDRNGNTTCRPTAAGTNGSNTCPAGANSENLTWDPENRPTAVSSSGQDVGDNVYDPDGTRLIHRDATGTTLYLPGEEIHRETGKGTTTRYYTFGDQLIGSRTSSGLTWLYTDHQGTQTTQINVLTQTAATRWQMPYGTPRGIQPTWPNGKGFVGGDKDTTGLTHLGAREYDPNLGRFGSVDPVQDLTDPQQWNGYSYANNAPITTSDPSGLKACSDDGCRSGADYVDLNGDYHYVAGHNDGCNGCSGRPDPDKFKSSVPKKRPEFFGPPIPSKNPRLTNRVIPKPPFIGPVLGRPATGEQSAPKEKRQPPKKRNSVGTFAPFCTTLTLAVGMSVSLQGCIVGDLHGIGLMGSVATAGGTSPQFAARAEQGSSWMPGNIEEQNGTRPYVSIDGGEEIVGGGVSYDGGAGYGVMAGYGIEASPGYGPVVVTTGMQKTKSIRLIDWGLG